MITIDQQVFSNRLMTKQKSCLSPLLTTQYRRGCPKDFTSRPFHTWISSTSDFPQQMGIPRRIRNAYIFNHLKAHMYSNKQRTPALENAQEVKQS